MTMTAVALANDLSRSRRSRAAEERGGAVAHVVVGSPLGLARGQWAGSTGFGRGPGPGISRRRSARSARSGGLRYNPTTSRTFSTKYGSVENLKVSWRWGLSPKARQIRLIAVCDRPAGCLAIATRAPVGRVLGRVGLQGFGDDLFHPFIGDGSRAHRVGVHR